MTPQQLWDALHRWELNVEPVAGWETRGRPYSTAWAGIQTHHTAGGRNGNAPSLRVVTYGRSGLPGPLYNILVGRDGTIYLISANYVNHSGMGSTLVVGETRRNVAPSGSAAERGLRDDAGLNRYYFAISAEHTGVASEPWSDRQLDPMARACAAVCEVNGWVPERIPQHLETTRRKIDMSRHGPMQPIGAFRALVSDALQTGPGTPQPAPEPEPEPTPEPAWGQEDDMRVEQFEFTGADESRTIPCGHITRDGMSWGRGFIGEFATAVYVQSTGRLSARLRVGSHSQKVEIGAGGGGDYCFQGQGGVFLDVTEIGTDVRGVVEVREFVKYPKP